MVIYRFMISGILGNQLFFLVIGRKIAKRLVNDLLYFIGLKMEVRSILDMHGSTDVDAKGWVTLGSDLRQRISRKSPFLRRSRKSYGRDGTQKSLKKRKSPLSRRPAKSYGRDTKKKKSSLGGRKKAQGRDRVLKSSRD